MITDALLNFVTQGSPLSLVGAAGATFASSVIDLAGVGSGNAITNWIGNVATFGTDLGIGEDRLLLDVVIGTALATANSCTLTCNFQLAPDNGSNSPGTWQTVVATPAITAAQGTANSRIARFDWPPAYPENLQPRFARLLFSTPSGEDFTAGTIAYALVTMARDDYSAQYAARNYVVA